MIEQEQLRIFKRIDIVGRRLTCLETCRVGDPPTLNREPLDVFFSLIVKRVKTQAALRDERDPPADVSCLQEILSFPQLLGDHHGRAEMEIFLRHFHGPKDLIPQSFKHGSGEEFSGGGRRKILELLQKCGFQITFPSQTACVIEVVPAQHFSETRSFVHPDRATSHSHRRELRLILDNSRQEQALPKQAPSNVKSPLSLSRAGSLLRRPVLISQLR
ncbi:MAG TPA: hypothetical protein VMG09_08480 [Bacteroidota bacterium]|nr:hypothetical protein [Bacteroidota bacterium]